MRILESDENFWVIGMVNFLLKYILCMIYKNEIIDII